MTVKITLCFALLFLLILSSVLQDEGVDSDDDDTSLSSYGSDLSSRKGYSASALSLTDVSWTFLFLKMFKGQFAIACLNLSVS